MEKSIVYSKTNRIFFGPCGRNNDYYIFDRKKEDSFNIDDIAQCAALAFHKSLIGVAELNSIETAGSKLRFAKAVQSYYPVYHLFICNMLLDDNYEIQYRSKGSLEYEVDKAILNDPSELPEQWNKGRELEQDLASTIQHGSIRKYCEKMRGQDIRTLPPWTQILYANFVKPPEDRTEKCISGLFEKMEYIRDRAIYRPTYVICEDGHPAQTSKDVRKEIDSLPSSETLYTAIYSFYKAIVDHGTSEQMKLFLSAVNSKTVNSVNSVNCRSKDVRRLGYTWDAIEQMNGNREKQEAPSYLIQMMELFDMQDTLHYYEKYWAPIFQIQIEKTH